MKHQVLLLWLTISRFMSTVEYSKNPLYCQVASPSGLYLRHHGVKNRH